MNRAAIDSRLLPALQRSWMLMFLLGLGCLPAFGQNTEPGSAAPRGRQLQLGVGIIPGLGLQTGYVSPRGFYTVEGVLYLYGSPRFAGGEADVQLALGLGAALRPLGLIRTIGNTGYAGYDIDLGLRIGPGLTFAVGQDETIADKNKRFNLVFEPFARLIKDLESGRTFYVEAGGQRPFIRAGLWIGF